ncbi:uncharacterized protein PV09_03037 [Verruconis gallopava]|uniref:gamma-glutamylcyclotransferase n=1 Tax=Verruconis gallopava TaxID=253628 RepID=A0A0D1YYQ5_9PEZI|nr:uncharacterized protein PV09_03037 [Verruconis gallopava]KIW05832.1 hypothetical protein PV09_03037 [Verruconis gallopava]
MSPSSPSAKLYFGYGSNLWIEQMHSRCPNSHFVGLGRLPGFKWIINERGYANVVELAPAAAADNEVWGLIYYLSPLDEARLDRNEGVPYAYTKEMLPIEFWPHQLADLDERIDVTRAPSVRKESLVYIDRKRVTESAPKDEYIVRMNKGIADASALGMPNAYVERVMRHFIPAGREMDSLTLRKAQRQAIEFVDENLE